MALTTHEKIRLESGFQSQFIRQPFLNATGVSTNTFFVDSDDNVKFVPNFNTGNTIAGVSDIQVWLGLSGIYGASQLAVSAIDIDQGSVRLAVVPPTGSSVVISYASSAITSRQVEDVRLQSEAIINQRLSLCYNLPITPTPSSLISMASRLGAAFLLIRNYGMGAQNTSVDGYKLYELLMGGNQALINQGTDSEATNVGEIGLICLPNYQLVDDDGVIIPRNDADSISGSNTFVAGGRVTGRLYDITEETFRFKPFQDDVNTSQPGSGREGV
jgi:hypothetical protein